MYEKSIPQNEGLQARASFMKGIGAETYESPIDGDNKQIKIRLASMLDQISKDEKLKDDSVEIERKQKKEVKGNLLNKLKFTTLSTIVNKPTDDDIDLDWIIEDMQVDEDSKNILDRSFIIPQPEINLKFNDLFTDNGRYSLNDVTFVNQVIYGDI